jgi:glycosyltransferase involved in cell wall biosynthesis
VIVDDSTETSAAIRANFGSAGLAGLTIIQNSRTKGAAGAWNTGLDFIRANFGEAWVAILDDDDEWSDDHLRSCHAGASGDVDAVIGGIVTYVDGVPASVAMHEMFTLELFLRHNPGWQGSNTFVRLSALEKAGRFDEALACTHDRDLAIRLLELEGFVHVRTGTETVRYHIGAAEPAYTRRLNPVKLEGLRGFWAKHRGRMTEAQHSAFLSHAADMFGFNSNQITRKNGPQD